VYISGKNGNSCSLIREFTIFYLCLEKCIIRAQPDHWSRCVASCIWTSDSHYATCKESGYARQSKNRFRLPRPNHIVSSEVLFSSLSEDGEIDILWYGFQVPKKIASASYPECPSICCLPNTHTIMGGHDTHFHTDFYEKLELQAASSRYSISSCVKIRWTAKLSVGKQR
jgi:hypothetical protein